MDLEGSDRSGSFPEEFDDTLLPSFTHDGKRAFKKHAYTWAYSLILSFKDKQTFISILCRMLSVQMPSTKSCNLGYKQMVRSQTLNLPQIL